MHRACRCALAKLGRGNLLPNSNRHHEKHILLVDPDEAFGRVLQQVLGAGYALRRVSTVETGISQLDAQELDVVLLNLDLQHASSSAQDSVLRAASERAAAPPVIAFGWDARHETAMEALQQGAVDFLQQPLDIQELKFALDGACRRAALARDLAIAQKFLSSAHVEGLLGTSAAMEQVNEL